MNEIFEDAKWIELRLGRILQLVAKCWRNNVSEKARKFETLRISQCDVVNGFRDAHDRALDFRGLQILSLRFEFDHLLTQIPHIMHRVVETYKFEAHGRSHKHQAVAEYDVSLECEGDYEWVHQNHNLIKDDKCKEEMLVHVVVGCNEF